MLKAINVEYILSEREYNRLLSLNDLYEQATRTKHDPEDTFRALMVLGSSLDMEKKMSYAENNFRANIKITA